MTVLRLLETMSKDEREELLFYVKCSLADVNRMYAEVMFSEEDDLGGGMAAIRAAGLETAIAYEFKEDDPGGIPPTVFVAVTGVSKLREHAFFGWLDAIVEPFGGMVWEDGYADRSPNPNASRDH